MYRSILKTFLIAGLAAGVLMCIRLYVVEPDEMAQACAAAPETFICQVRNMAVYGFSRRLFGPISLVAGVLGALGRLRLFAVLAVVAGMAGVILYDFELSALGLLAGALSFARFDAGKRQQRERQQSTPHTPA